jgi:hypothetical protein
VLAATVWVGGQLTLAALVPALRALGREPTHVAARAFNRVAWPAFGVLVVTGVWNVFAEREHISGRYETTLVVKICLVAASGLSAALHSRSRSRAGLAVFGALSGATALGAVFVGSCSPSDRRAGVAVRLFGRHTYRPGRHDCLQVRAIAHRACVGIRTYRCVSPNETSCGCGSSAAGRLLLAGRVRCAPAQAARASLKVVS